MKPVKLGFKMREIPMDEGLRDADRDRVALNRIAEMLDEQVWDVEMFDEIAAEIRLTGRAVRDVADVDEPVSDEERSYGPHWRNRGKTKKSRTR